MGGYSLHELFVHVCAVPEGGVFEPFWSEIGDMLTNLGWRSLQQRCVDSRLSLLYKIAHNLTPSCHKDQLRPPRRRSRHMHEQSFLPLSCSTTSHRLSFFPRTISQWNNLPNHVFSNCNSLNQFRNRISSLQHIPVNLNYLFIFFFNVFMFCCLTAPADNPPWEE